jgi:aryl-alcohol dehydrogenase-like predicted oxidoreductase
MELRPLGKTNLRVSPVALGCWPIAGMTSAGVNDADSLATIEACFELGINHLDTAYAYGLDGESERLIAKAIGTRRDQMVIATKGGIHWGADRDQLLDGRPETLRWECEASLQRLNTDRVELYYLHAPDPNTPVTESAGAIKQLIDEGKVLAAGLSNATVAQLEEFSAACPLSAFQPPYNMLQRDIEADTLPWCQAHNVSVLIYWPLMKGLLTGKFARDHRFPPGDGRLKYPAFQGDQWQKNHDLLDELRSIANEIGRTVTQVVINWTIHQSGITSALCGEKRPDQIRDSAGAMGWQLTPDCRKRIDDALARRGKPQARSAV